MGEKPGKGSTSVVVCVRVVIICQQGSMVGLVLLHFISRACGGEFRPRVLPPLQTLPPGPALTSWSGSRGLRLIAGQQRVWVGPTRRKRSR